MKRRIVKKHRNRWRRTYRQSMVYMLGLHERWILQINVIDFETLRPRSAWLVAQAIRRLKAVVSHPE